MYKIIMAGKRTTLAFMAEQLGVSKITVSRALKGQPGVSDSLRQDARELAARLGYEYERLRIPGEKRRFLYLTPKRFFLASDSFYHAIYYELSSLCLAIGSELSVRILERDAELAGVLPEDAGKASGIFIGGEIAENALIAINALGVPWVTIDYNITNGLSDCVIVDNYMTGIIATEYLYSRGYQRIGFVGSYRQSSNISDRINGFMKVVRQRNLYFQDDWLIDNYDETTANYLVDIQLPADLPEAFVCHCDRAAYYFIEKLKSVGLSVPADVGIISIDNTDLAASCTPPLTSVNIDKRHFAEEALRLMNDRMGSQPGPRRRYIDTMIVERKSAPYKTKKK